LGQPYKKQEKKKKKIGSHSSDSAAKTLPNTLYNILIRMGLYFFGITLK
jgi:hypothetical protein